MKPVRRNIKRHFGLTSKQVAVRSHRPWYFQSLLALGFVILGAALAYWYFYDDETDSIRAKIKTIEAENRTLQNDLIGAQRALQVELATNNNLAKELAKVQDDSLKIKEDLVFYKNMLGKNNNK
jgi:hypothetical protein